MMGEGCLNAQSLVYIHWDILIDYDKIIDIYFFLFIQKSIYNVHINKMKKSKTKINIAVIRWKATITPEIKLKEEQYKLTVL